MLACFGRGRRNNAQIFDEPKTISPEDTIRNLRSHIKKQEKRELFLEKKMLVLAKEAKERLNRGDKRGAVTVMKKRQMYQSEMSSISNIKMTLETQAIHLESAVGTADAFRAMSSGNATMTQIRNDMGGIDGVDDVLMDIQAEMNMGEELNTVLATSTALGTIDDDDLMKELEEEMEREQQEQVQKTNEAVLTYLPTVPTSKLSEEEEAREAIDLRKIETEQQLREENCFDHEQRRTMKQQQQKEGNNIIHDQNHMTKRNNKNISINNDDSSSTMMMAKNNKKQFSKLNLKLLQQQQEEEHRDLKMLEAELQEDHDLRRLENELAM